MAEGLAIFAAALVFVAIGFRWGVTHARSNFDDVGDFHEQFGLDNVTHGGALPSDLTMDVVNFRILFMEEELKEFCEAVDGVTDNDASHIDHAKAFDALLDLVYVALGTAHLLGYPWQEGWARVQGANMAKERAASSGDPRSKRGHALDVVKPAGWQPPDVAGVLRRHGWDL